MLPSKSFLVLKAWADVSGVSLVSRFDGGKASEVWLASRRSEYFVVKKLSDPGEAVSEAAWLSLHPFSPGVLEFVESESIIVMERLDAVSLRERVPVVDVGKEAGWLDLAHDVALSMPLYSEFVLRDVFDMVSSRLHVFEAGYAASEFEELRFLVDRYVLWLSSVSQTDWVTVPFDFIAKNTLVSGEGVWFSIDPLCVRAPHSFVYLAWAVSRRNFSAGEVGSPNFDSFLSLSADPDEAYRFVGVLLIWTLSWVHGTPNETPMVLKTLEYLKTFCGF